MVPGRNLKYQRNMPWSIVLVSVYDLFENKLFAANSFDLSLLDLMLFDTYFMKCRLSINTKLKSGKILDNQIVKDGKSVKLENHVDHEIFPISNEENLRLG